jgi:CRP-like cAMP-binding protein
MAVSIVEHRNVAGAPLTEPTGSRPESLSNFTSYFDMWAEDITLRPQQRLVPTGSGRNIIAVRDGTLAVEAMLPIGRRQILDFLLPGDIVTTSSLLCPRAFPSVSMRAMTPATLACIDHRTTPADRMPEDYWETLFIQTQAQLARANAHRLMIGHLDTTSRVASFLLAIALRTCGGNQLNLRFALPMSRDDIADYLAMNSDTLSRIMMRFEALTLIERVNRREVRVSDINKLKVLTPIAQLLASVFEHRRPHLAI